MKYFFIKIGLWPMLILMGTLGILACAPQRLTLTRSQLLMGHVPVNISVRTESKKYPEALAATESAYQLARELEAKISEFQPASEISCLNRQAGKGPCPLSPETTFLLEAALKLSERTRNAFDIRFASKSPAGRIGAVDLSPGSGTGKLVHPDTRIGVGAIGKGYIVDKMVERMAELGFSQVLIDAGGDLRAAGGPWEVAIQIPGAPLAKTTGLTRVRDEAWASSGLYEKGRHIVDPRDLTILERGGGVTVRAPTLTEADALATAFFVLGKKDSEEVARQFPRVSQIWLEEYVSGGLRPKADPPRVEKPPATRPTKGSFGK